MGELDKHHWRVIATTKIAKSRIPTTRVGNIIRCELINAADASKQAQPMYSAQVFAVKKVGN